MSFERITVDVLDNAGAIQGSGPLYNIVSATVEEVLDQAGRISVTVPAHDARAISLLSASNTRLRVHILGAVLHTGIVDNLAIVGGPNFQASGPDLLAELGYLNCGYDRVYDGKDVLSEIIGATGTATSLLEGTGWTQGSVEDYGLMTIKFDAETRLRAIIMVGEQLGRHIRQGSTEQTLDFGLFGSDSGIRIIDVDAFRDGMEDSDIVAYLGQIPSITSITADVFNRIFPLGKDRFDMRDARKYQIDSDNPLFGTITDATNATPIVITSNGHGLSTSDFVRITGVEGNTAANGDWQITRLTDNTFSLDTSVGNGAYTAGGRWEKVIAAAILVVENGGPIGVATTVAAGVTATDTTVTVADSTGFLTGQELWIGDATDWTLDHEIAIVDSVVGADVHILSEFENSYAIGKDVIQAPQFYVEDAASQATHGVRENCPQFGWIGPVDLSGNLPQQQRAADALYAAASAYLVRYKDEYESYGLPLVLNLPTTLRVGEKVRLVYKGVVGILGGEVFADIDALFYVMKISRKYAANGTQTASLEIANVSRPTPTNTSLVLFNLDSNRWVNLG